MDAVELLLQDHQVAESLFQRYEVTGEGAAEERVEVVRAIVHELQVHTAIEEEVFYPAVATRGGDHGMPILQAEQEHHVVGLMLTELGGMTPQDPVFDAKVRVLIKLVREHVREEESILLPEARRVLRHEEAEELGEQMVELKRRQRG